MNKYDMAKNGRATTFVNGWVWSVDPLHLFKGCGIPDLIEACGIVPMFFDADKAVNSLDELKTQAGDGYGWGLTEITGGEIVNGVYCYPEDSPLAPIMVGFNGACQVFIYQYGIVALSFDDDGKYFITRMD